jgi:hypothetical protein
VGKYFVTVSRYRSIKWPQAYPTGRRSLAKPRLLGETICWQSHQTSVAEGDQYLPAWLPAAFGGRAAIQTRLARRTRIARLRRVRRAKRVRRARQVTKRTRIDGLNARRRRVRHSPRCPGPFGAPPKGARRAVSNGQRPTQSIANPPCDTVTKYFAWRAWSPGRLRRRMAGRLRRRPEGTSQHQRRCRTRLRRACPAYAHRHSPRSSAGVVTKYLMAFGQHLQVRTSYHCALLAEPPNLGGHSPRCPSSLRSIHACYEVLVGKYR